MYTDINKRLEDYAKKLKEHDAKGDYNSILDVIRDYNIYLKGLLDYEQDDLNRNWYNSLQIYLVLLERYAKISKTQKEKDDEHNTNMNSLTEKVNNLEKRISAIEKGV